MSFPERTLRVPRGWKDLGKLPVRFEGYDTFITDRCPFDRRRLRYGIEDCKIFTYCPKCNQTFK